MARIAIGGFQHETNCFVPQKTDFDYFAAHRDRPPLCRGADVIDWLTGISFGMSGFLEEMAADHEMAPLLWTSGGAGGMVTRDAFERIAGYVQDQDIGERKVNYRLRDWGVSRQRYWGCPVPVIYCDSCGAVPVPDADLPVLLPEDVTFMGVQSPI